MTRAWIAGLSLLVLAAFGQQYFVPSKSPTLRYAGTAAACAIGDTTNSWDDFLEGFTSGYDSNSVWGEVGTTANITEGADSSAATTSKPPGACDTALQVIVPADGTETYSRATIDVVDLDTVQTDVTASFYIDTAPASGKASGLIQWGRWDSPDSWTAQLEVSNSSGQLRVRCSAVGAYINIDADTWYTAVVSFDTARAVNGSSLKVYAGGSQVGSTQTFQRNAADLARIFLGAPEGLAADEGFTAFFDLICVKTN